MKKIFYKLGFRIYIKNFFWLCALVFIFYGCRFYLDYPNKGESIKQLSKSIYVKPVLNSTSYPVIEYFVEDDIKYKILTKYDVVFFDYQADFILDVELTEADYDTKNIKDANDYDINSFTLKANVKLNDASDVKKLDDIYFTTQATYEQYDFGELKYVSDIQAGFEQASKMLATKIIDRIDQNLYYK